jgi:PhzF family phenazine biosynthesis protein
MPSLDYLHVDVFSARPYGGNGLPVFHDAPELTAAQMLGITQELRQFEAIFIQRTSTPSLVRARVFDLFEELPFAGHPLIGAAAALHHLTAPSVGGAWTLDLSGRNVTVQVERRGEGFSALLDQGEPEFIGSVEDGPAIAAAFGLLVDELHPALPLEVASTGLRYLVVPLAPDRIGRARVAHDLTALLRGFGAQFAVLLDPATLEIRHWNNDGVIEDVATGSAAGVVAAYCVKHGVVPPGQTISLAQGRFTGRPSTLDVRVDGGGNGSASVKVGGMVAIVGRGALNQAPEVAA